MTVCTHSWRKPGEPLVITQTLDDWLGPTLALTVCSACQQEALLFLIAWEGHQLSHRIFGIRELPSRITQTYLANVARDYCDLTRKQSETEALIQAAQGPTCLVAAYCPGLEVSCCSDTEDNPPVKSWQDVSEADWSHWHAYTSP